MFREIIVLDNEDEDQDDEDDDLDGETSEGTPLDDDERGHSLEIISSQATARELQPDYLTDYPRADTRGPGRIPRRRIVLRLVEKGPRVGPNALSAPRVIRAHHRSPPKAPFQPPQPCGQEGYRMAYRRQVETRAGQPFHHGPDRKLHYVSKESCWKKPMPTDSLPL